VHPLVLDQPVGDRGAVFRDAGGAEAEAPDAEFFAKPALGAGLRVLAPMRVRADRVGPEPAAMVLRIGAALDEQAVAVEDEGRDGEVQDALAMRLELFDGVERPVRGDAGNRDLAGRRASGSSPPSSSRSWPPPDVVTLS
jgi:hypothetical protein